MTGGFRRLKLGKLALVTFGFGVNGVKARGSRESKAGEGEYRAAPLEKGLPEHAASSGG